MDGFELFPYAPRGEQTEIMELIRATVASRRHAVIESGTGTGKTICSLVGVLEDQPYHGFKAVYLTRTKSQQKQVMAEMRQINTKRSIFAVALQGRSPTTCPMMRKDGELITGTPDELSKWCSEFKKNRGKTGGCPYYDKMEKIDVQKVIMDMRSELPDPETFQNRCIEMGVCPYEMTKAALPFANLVCVPYSFLLTPAARFAFLGWLDAPLNELVVITDEAHNVPDYLREVVTSEYTLHALDYAEKEAREWDDPLVNEDLRVTGFIEAMRNCFREAIAEYLTDDDGLVPPYFLEESLMSQLGVTSLALDRMYKTLVDLGETVVAKKKEMRKLPRSYMRSLGSFLQAWTLSDETCYAKLINGGDNPSFEAYCMDPYIAAEPFRDCRSSIHMSGTLEPLEEYVEELGLENVNVRCFASPFNPDNLLSLYADDVTTRHDDLVRDPDLIRKIERHTVDIVRSTVRNTAVFFPSYAMMDRFIADDVPILLDREIFYEKREMSQTELMDTVGSFRMSEGSVLFAVTGGKISEGLDFPDKDLELAILIGIPYPYPTAKLNSLIRYADIRFGHGWDHAVKSPTTRKMRQARGRLIRSETDRGVCVVLDSRVASIQGFDARPSDDILSEIRAFFDE